MDMETLLSTPITVPMSQIICAMLLCTIALVFGRVKVALFVAYCFMLYWGKPWNLQLFTDTVPAKLNGAELALIGFCFVTVLLAMMGLVFNKE
jgi:hypothetical protein